MTWTPDAEQDLAAVWLAVPDRDAVTAAAHAIDQRLETQPLAFGESRESGVSRFGVVRPLAVWFEVIADDRRVIVHAVAAAG